MNNENWFIERIDDRTIKTIFGMAKIQKTGYYIITSRKEGNNNKKLHHLVWEYGNNQQIPQGYVIHHKNHIKTDNRLDNLILMDNIQHKKHHTRGDSNPMYGVRGKDHPMFGADRSGKNNPFYKKKHTSESLNEMSVKKTNTGIFRVSKRVCKKCKQGFIFGYRWKDGQKTQQISSSRLFDLKSKIDSTNLPWRIVDQKKFNNIQKEEIEVDERARQL